MGGPESKQLGWKLSETVQSQRRIFESGHPGCKSPDVTILSDEPLKLTNEHLVISKVTDKNWALLNLADQRKGPWKTDQVKFSTRETDRLERSTTKYSAIK